MAKLSFMSVRQLAMSSGWPWMSSTELSGGGMTRGRLGWDVFCFGIAFPYVSDKYRASSKAAFFCKFCTVYKVFFCPTLWRRQTGFFPESPHVLSSVLISRVFVSSSAFQIMAGFLLAGLRCLKNVSEHL